MPIDPIAAFFLSFIVGQLVPNMAAEFIYDVSKNRYSKVFEQLSLGNRDLAEALDRSYRKAIGSISLGLRPSWNRVGVWEEKVVREFADKLESNYLSPFYEKHEAKLDADMKRRFRRDSGKNCRMLLQQSTQVLQLSTIKNHTIQQLLLPIQPDPSSKITDIETLGLQTRTNLLERVRDIDEVDALFCDFLEYENLLVNAIAFFFLEVMKSDQRVQTVLHHFDIQALRIELSKISLQRDDSRSLEISEERQSKIISMLEKTVSFSSEISQTFEGLQNIAEEQYDRILSEIEEVRQGVDELKDSVEGLRTLLVNAVKEENFEEIIQVSEALVNLENRRQNKVVAEQFDKSGVAAYQQGMDAFKSENQEQSLIQFKEAEKLFHKAIELTANRQSGVEISY